MLYLGSINRRSKAIDVLLDAFEQHIERDNIHLALIGDPDDAAGEALLARLRGLGSPRLTHLGYQSDPSTLLSAADVCVLPSRRESFGRTVIEALACGVPIVASNVDGIPEILYGDLARYLVPPEDPVALRRAVLTVLEEPRARWRAEALREHARQFSVEKHAAKLDEVFRRVRAVRSAGAAVEQAEGYSVDHCGHVQPRTR